MKIMKKTILISSVLMILCGSIYQLALAGSLDKKANGRMIVVNGKDVSSIRMTAFNENPYTGKYKSSNNTILELGSNNNCTIINNLYKDAFYTEGKYVIKDNKITITFGKNEPNYYGVPILKGKFEGSIIKIYNSLESKYSIYSKE